MNNDELRNVFEALRAGLAQDGELRSVTLRKVDVHREDRISEPAILVTASVLLVRTVKLWD